MHYCVLKNESFPFFSTYSLAVFNYLFEPYHVEEATFTFSGSDRVSIANSAEELQASANARDDASV